MSCKIRQNIAQKLIFVQLFLALRLSFCFFLLKVSESSKSVWATSSDFQCKDATYLMQRRYCFNAKTRRRKDFF